MDGIAGADILCDLIVGWSFGYPLREDLGVGEGEGLPVYLLV